MAIDLQRPGNTRARALVMENQPVACFQRRMVPTLMFTSDVKKFFFEIMRYLLEYLDGLFFRRVHSA